MLATHAPNLMNTLRIHTLNYILPQRFCIKLAIKLDPIILGSTSGLAVQKIT